MFRTIEDGKVRVTGTHLIFCGTWVRCQVKRPHKCALSGRPIAMDSLAYRPMTNVRSDRGTRVHVQEMERYAARDEAFK